MGGFNNASLGKRKKKIKEKEKMTAGALYSATLEWMEAWSALLLTLGMALCASWEGWLFIVPP